MHEPHSAGERPHQRPRRTPRRRHRATKTTLSRSRIEMGTTKAMTAPDNHNQSIPTTSSSVHRPCTCSTRRLQVPLHIMPRTNIGSGQSPRIRIHISGATTPTPTRNGPSRPLHPRNQRTRRPAAAGQSRLTTECFPHWSERLCRRPNRPHSHPATAAPLTSR